MPPPILLVTTDPDLVDHTLRLAAAAGTEVHVARQVDVARWREAAVVLVGADCAADCAARGLPRRNEVIVVACRDPFAAPDLPTATWQSAVGVGASHVICLPDGERWLIDRLGEAADAGDTGGPIISIISGAGGAGGTTFARLLTSAMRDGALLLDLDPVSAGFPELPLVGLKWSDLADTRGRVPSGALRDSLPQLGRTHVLTGVTQDVDLPARMAVLDAAARGFPLTVVDLPRSIDDDAQAVWSHSNLVVVVVGPHASRVGAALPLIDAVREATESAVIVPRTGPGAMAGWVHDIADIVRLPVTAAWRHDRSLGRGESSDVASPRTWRPAVQAVLHRVAIPMSRHRTVA